MARPAAEAYTDFVLALMEFHGLLESHGEQLTRPCGQTPARWQVLGALAGQALTVPQIARRMGLSRQAVQRVAHVLEQEALLRFVANLDHQRSPKLELTAAGSQLLAQINARQAVWAEAIGAQVQGPELERASKLLRTLSGILADMNDKAWFESV